MSLILDALRKSEAERRRGEKPSLYAQLPVPATRLRPWWLPWLPAVLGVLLLAGIGVWYMREPDAPATKDELVEDSQESLVPAPAAVTAAQNPVAANAPAPVPPPAPMAASHPANVAAPASTQPSVDALVKPAPNAIAPPGPASIAAAPSPAETSAPAAAADEVPPVAVLDPTTRGGLPPMKLSMHVYNADSARRFAIIDGHRVAEGGQVGNAIVLEIRRDGVLLDVAGRRVLLPRP
jgi:general secretion pathway protein B